MSALLQELDLAGARQCAAFNLRGAARAVSQAYDAGLAPTGLRATQFAILVGVAAHQPVAVGELAQVLLSDQTTMTRNLRLLQRDGLIDKPERGANREKRVRLTAAGERKLKAAMPVWRAVQERFTEAFGIQKWRELRRELRRASSFMSDQG